MDVDRGLLQYRVQYIEDVDRGRTVPVDRTAEIQESAVPRKLQLENQERHDLLVAINLSINQYNQPTN